MEPHNYEEKLLIMPKFYVPEGDSCVGCKFYDYHGYHCKLFGSDVVDDKKIHECTDAVVSSETVSGVGW